MKPNRIIAVIATVPWLASSLAAWSAGTSASISSTAPASGEGNNLVSSSGEASYRIPFEVPPGRNGAQPTVELVYGSRSPLRGGIAAGWRLPLSRIHVDTTAGRTQRIVYAVDGTRLIQSADQASQGGTTYRAYGDSSYTIYEHVPQANGPGTWTARAPDGSVREYGTTTSSADVQVDPGTQYGGQGRWFIARSIDVRGNQVVYNYTTAFGTAHDGALPDIPVDRQLVSITYGRNVNVASSKDVAAIDFSYADVETCSTSAVPIGAQFDFRTGIRMYVGARKLTSISSRVYDPTLQTWTTRRELDLGYDATAAACNQPHAPMRMLASTQLKVWSAAGTQLVLPATTFSYGPLDYDFALTPGTSQAQPGSGSTHYGPRDSFNISDNQTADIAGNGSPSTLTPATLPTGGCYVGNTPVPGFAWETGIPPDNSVNNGFDMCSGSEQFAVHPTTPNSGPPMSCPYQRIDHERLIDLNGDGLPDLVTQLSYQGPNYNPSQDPQLENVTSPWDYPTCTNFGNQPCHAADGSPAPCLLDPAQLLLGYRGLGPTRWTGALPVSGQANACAIVPDMRCGFYVLRMYANLGNGTFATTPTVVFSPVPLALADYSSEFGSNDNLSSTAPTRYALVDMDGDGALDGVFEPTDFPNSYSFIPNLGDGSGQFSSVRVDWWMPTGLGIEAPAAGPYLDAANRTVSSRPYGSTDNNAWHQHTQSGRGTTLADINGDGLPDLVHTITRTNTTPDQLVVYYNTGAGFESEPTSLEGSPTHVGYFALNVTVPFVLDSTQDEAISDGYAVATRRPVDLDGDGLTDVAVMAAPVSNQYAPNGNPDTSVTAYVNLGDKLVPAPMPTTRAAAWYASLLDIVGYHGDGVWATGTDVVDTDGDGLPEVQQLAVDNGSHGCFQGNFGNCGNGGSKLEATQQPYRLLTGVDNGLGMTMAFKYASARDPAVVSVVSSDITHRMQAPLVVVKEIDVAITGAPTATTTFSYQNPRTAPDAFGRTGFRGFEQVTEVGPIAESGARRTTIRRTDFTVDPDGRESAFVIQTDSTLVSELQRTWIASNTFGTIPSYLEVETRSFTCKPRTEALPTAEADCIAHDPVARHVESWQPIHSGDTTACFGCATNPNTATIAYVRTLAARSGQLGAALPGDSAVSTAYEIHRAPSQWLVLANDTKIVAAATAGTFANATVWAHTTTTYDAGGRALPVATLIEQKPGVFATIARTFDTFGNLATTMRPNQVALGAGGRSRAITYDALGLMPIASVDELGHRIEQDWDTALGAVTETRGPQFGPNLQRFDAVYDGLGRVVQRSRLADAGGPSPTNTIVFVATYSDTAANHSATTTSRLDYSPANWLQVTTTLDGVGRSIQEAKLVGTNTWETQTHRYDGAGNLVETDVPNPAGGTPSTVAYTFAYDGLGRVTSEVAPASAPRTTTYAGVLTTITETPTDGSIGAQKVVTTDSFGRVLVVQEGATTKALTKYAYDPVDRIRHIVDADLIMTDIAFTLGGTRSFVLKNGVRVVYDYDLDGNRIGMHHPTPTGVNPNDPKWATTWSYDALDRVVASVPAVRDISATDQARLLANVATVYTYDEPARKNGIGRLTSVTYPFGTVTYDYTIEGFTAAETRSLSVAPDGVALASSGTLKSLYNAQGEPKVVTYPDDASAATSAAYTYDLQGRFNRLDIGQAGNNFQLGIVGFTRNAAGYVVSRTGTGNVAEQSYLYDPAGRPTKTDVSAYLHAGDTTKTALAGDGIAFLQNGNVQRWDDRATGREIAIAYDDLGRVLSATAGTDYAASFTYSPAGTILTANVQSALAGAQVTSRHVSYDRTIGTGDLADPAAVRGLKNVDGTAFASFGYDPSSNLRTRTVGTASTVFSYDGYDQLREAKSSAGDEIYFYDRSGMRVLVYRAASAGKPASLRHRFGTTEIAIDTTGAKAETTDVVFGGHPAARVVNHDITQIETLYHSLQGNLVAAVDKNRVMRARYAYAPYGEILFSDGPEVAAFDHTYEDKARDTSTGLSYFGRRYYDPLTTTWTQADPLYRGLPDLAALSPRKAALFTYVLDNPLRFIDPDGRDIKPQLPPVVQRVFAGMCTAIDGCGWSHSSGSPPEDTPSSNTNTNALQSLASAVFSLVKDFVRDLDVALGTVTSLFSSMLDSIVDTQNNYKILANPRATLLAMAAATAATNIIENATFWITSSTWPHHDLQPPPTVDVPAANLKTKQQLKWDAFIESYMEALGEPPHAEGMEFGVE